MKHSMKLAKEPFGKMAFGTKVIESRLFDEKRRMISIGDEIEFSEADTPENVLMTVVEGIYPFPSFEELFAAFPTEQCGGDSAQGLSEEINTFYSEADQNCFGVVGIRIRVKVG